MTVLARTKSGVGRIRRNREGRPIQVAARKTAPDAAVITEGSTPARRRRREAGGLQDEAVYTCECGFVFHAPVSTSVGCPHCGSAQAW
jgi:predicted Zn-ribbon and HTH transcriptional regulator